MQKRSSLPSILCVPLVLAVLAVPRPATAQSREIALRSRPVAGETRLPPVAAYHVAHLVEAYRNYTAHARALARLDIARATQDFDTAIAEETCNALERDAAMLHQHVESLRQIFPMTLDRWLGPLSAHASSSWGAAMAIRATLDADGELEIKRNALRAARAFVKTSREMSILLGGLKQDLGVTAD